MTKPAANARKVRHGGPKIDDFFPRRSQGPMASGTSQPSSSQPIPSQTTTPVSSQQQSQPKPKLTTTNSRKRGVNAPPRADQEVISLSSDARSGGHISIPDDSASHISISSGSDPKRTKSIITISDSNSEERTKMPRQPLPSISAVKKPKGKDKTVASSSVLTSRSKKSLKPLSAVVPAATTSSAKTTIRRRSNVVSSVLASASSAPAPVPKKRKHALYEFDSPSEDSADGSVYIADPEHLPSSLSHAPEILHREDLIPESVLKPRNNSPLSVERHTKSTRTSSTSSKRMRLSPPSPALLPVDSGPADGHILDVRLEDHEPYIPPQPASSGNEADEEEIPSSQSDEQELTIPKTIVKDPQEIKKRVDHWRRTYSISSATGGVDAKGNVDISPLSEPTGMSSDIEKPPSSPLVQDVHTDLDIPVGPDDSFHTSEAFTFDDNVMMDVDVDTASPHVPATANPSYECEPQGAQVIQEGRSELPASTSNTSTSTLSSSHSADQSRPVTPPPHASTSVAVVAPIDSPFIDVGTPFKPKAIIDSPFRSLVGSPFKPLPDVDLLSGLTPEPEEVDQAHDVPHALPPPDAHTRALNMIEQIKAQAAATAALAQTNDDDSEGEVKRADWDFNVDASESSDEDELQFSYDFHKRTSHEKNATSGARASTSGASSSSAGPSTRYNLRRRASPAHPDDSSPSELPVTSQRDKGKAKATAGPLAQMVREKKKADRRGVGADVLAAAEAVVAEQQARMAREKERAKEKETGNSKGKMREEMDEEDLMASDGLGLGEFGRDLTLKSSGSSSDIDLEDSDDDELETTEDESSIDAVALLGSGDGDAVRKILKDDRNAAGKRRKEGKGIRIFEATRSKSQKNENENKDEDTMDVDSDNRLSAPALPFSNDELRADPVLSLLRVAINMRDTSRLCRYLTPAVVTRVKTEFMENLVNWLFEMATSPSMDALLTQRSVECLIAIARRSLPTSNLSQRVILTLLRLGARPDAFERVGFPVPTVTPPDAILEEIRHAALTRAVLIVRTFAENNAILPEDLPNLIVSLLPIALEPSTSPELQTDTMMTIDIVGACVPSCSDGFSPLEPQICSKVLAYAADFTPANKAFLLSFFCGGSPQTARISRWLARRLLLPEPTTSEAYSEYPPLKPLITLLSPSNGSEGIFDIPGNMTKPGYFEELANHLEILNVVFNDVDGYTLLEKEKDDPEVVSSSYASPGRSTEKPLTELEQIKNILDRLHGKIADTRSVDLARSSAKAALQQLAMRIHYTRIAAQGQRAARPNGGIKTWLQPIKRSSAI